MIKWKDMSGLHAINKLENILGKWFGVEVFYTDANYKIRSEHLDKTYPLHNNFFKVLREMNYGNEYLEQDIEKVTDELSSRPSGGTKLFDSFFPHVKGLSSKVIHEGEYLGTVFAYPFIDDTITKDECGEVIAKLVECGTSKEDAKSAVENLKRLTEKDKTYLKELVKLVSYEIETFHTEITKRDERIQDLNSELGDKYRYHSMIGKSKKMQQIYRLIEKVSLAESSVFVSGENGTGKELVAKAVHYSSPRKDNMFLAVNCSAFNDNLLDSELFGHVRGAFTGAIKDKKGVFESANGGTLFLDEIGDTSLSMQVKLLRVLQEGTYLPVGSSSPQKADVRIIVATNRDLKTMMQKGEFREDLFYRINVINIALPPLRDRRDDIPILCDHFLEKRCAESGMPTKVLSKKCLEVFLDYRWPGNVRELENEIERLVVLTGDDKTITPDILSTRILEYGVGAPSTNRGISTNGNLKRALEELEKIMIREGLKRCNFNKSKLAKELGISRASLIMKVDKYALDKRKLAANE